MKFILVRHTETAWNALHRLQGQTDIELNDLGHSEADALAEKFSQSGMKIAGIVSSDLRRAIQTARYFGALTGAALTVDSRLRECSFGSIEGLLREDVRKRYTPTRIDYPENWHGSYVAYDFSAFGGETRDQVLARHIAVLDKLARQMTTRAMLLVGHGCGLNTLLAGLGYEPNLERGECRTIEYPNPSRP